MWEPTQPKSIALQEGFFLYTDPMAGLVLDASNLVKAVRYFSQMSVNLSFSSNLDDQFIMVQERFSQTDSESNELFWNIWSE